MTPAVRYWQIAAFVAALLPQHDRLPLWLSALAMLACLWRLPAVERRQAPPGGVLRAVLMMAGMAGVVYSHRTLLGPEGGVSFLILAAALKLLETRDRRDVFVLAVLDVFVLSTAFLFSQSLLLTVYAGLALVVIVAALQALQQAPGTTARRTLWRASVLVGQALPLMLVLFVFFPRLPPLWTFNLTQGTGKTGMSDSMSPGDISALSESSALAFRVEFDGPVPPVKDLYWRGLVLSRFDGQRWTQNDWLGEGDVYEEGRPFLPSWRTGIVVGNAPPLRYRVILEPTDRTWLFGLDLAQSATPKVGMTRDFRLQYRQPVFQRLTYEVRSYPAAALDREGLSVWMQRDTLQLPDGNPQSREQARRWRLALRDDRRYVQHVLDWFREERFFYTLRPPALGEQRIDEFLFRTRRGFCEHYAASFVFLMRAAGIPARVVVGYQGGEISPLGDYLMVRQLDAHAWAEVWLQGSGWVRVDPTAAVAPGEIVAGASRLAENPGYWGGGGLAAMRYGNYRLFRELRHLADYVNYRWQRDVLGYDTDKQQGLMQRLLGDTSLLRRLAVMGVLLAVLAGALFLWALHGERQPRHPLDRLYLRFCRQMAARGIARAPGESPSAYAERIAGAKPALATRARAITGLFVALRYRDGKDPAQERRLRRLVRGF
ncbi:MAG: DUF3488 and DUF4129 domain-containing transglutaminase family protein [Moraxellaceae bacterium]